jgi:hypothetical protein
MHQKWTEEEIQQIILSYLKGNLTIAVDASPVDSYDEHESKYVAITVKVSLDGLMIADERTSFRIK